MACRKLDSLVIIFTIILMVAGIPGCSDDSSDGIENNGVNVSGSTFDWDAGHPIPVNREGSVIDFYSTTEKEEVINQSLETGKLIFCYLSKYDDFQTNEVESVFIANSRWGAEINRRYIPWEVDFWIDPTLALYLSSGGGHAVDRSPAWLPAIILLKPDEEDSDKFLVVECWKLSDIPYFPFKCTSGTYSYEQGMENSPKETEVGDALDAFETAEGLQFAYYRNPPNNILNPLSEMRWMLDLEVEYVDGDGRTGPDLLTYLALQELIDGKEFQNLPKEINQWAEWNFSMIDTNFISLNTCPTLDPSLSTGTIMGVDIPDNLIGMALAHSQDIDYPVNPGDMFDELYSMVVDEDGNFTGGFPAYIDSNFTLGAYDHVMPDVNPFELLFNENAMEDLLADPPPVFGPRDIVWVNARILTLWLQMVKFDAELKKLEMPNGQDAGEFLYELSAVMLASMEDLVNIDTPVDMNLADRT
ncbi:hypothetical protein KAU08_05205, partial [bacterium]|nr:hypothetical protein [bacterium]